MAIVITFGLVACEKEKPCEKNNFGTVIVTNNGSYPIYVDCTQVGQNLNEERYLAVGQHTEYQMTPGQVTEWATPAADYPCNCNWFTDSYMLAQCETHNDPWGSAKGSFSSPLIKINRYYIKPINVKAH